MHQNFANSTTPLPLLSQPDWLLFFLKSTFWVVGCGWLQFVKTIQTKSIKTIAFVGIR